MVLILLLGHLTLFYGAELRGMQISLKSKPGAMNIIIQITEHD